MSQTRFDHAIALFDAANAEDPNQEIAEGKSWPKELLYAQRMSEMLMRFMPEADEDVRLACRAQHIQRWKIPRQDYPMTREGYLMWRTALYKLHADLAGELMAQAGYEPDLIEQVKRAISKRGMKVNPATQALEDVVALVFLEHYMTGFAAHNPDYSEEKWLDIVRKTWKKMSEAGRAFALSGRIRLPADLLPLIQKAIREE